MQFLILEKCQSSWNPCHSPHHSLMQKWAIKSSTKPPKCWFWHHRNTPGFFLHVIWLSLKASELEAPEICSRWVWLLNLRLQRFAVDGFLWSIGGDIVYKLNSFWNAYSLLFRGINCNCKLTLHQMSTVAAAAAKSLHSYLTLCDLMDCGLPGSSIHGILQARILEWVAISFSKGSSWPRDWTFKWAHLIVFLLPWQELQLSLADNSESSICPIKILYNFFSFYYLLLHRASLGLVWLFFLCSNLCGFLFLHG